MTRFVRTSALSGGGALLILALLGAPVRAQVGLPVGTAAPAAALQDLDGNAVDILDYVEPGKPTVLEFWATWCEQCEALQPRFDRVQELYGDRVNIVAVAVAVSQSVRRVRRHLERHDPGYTYLWDARGAAVRAYNAPTTAVVVILDGDGKVAYSGVGSDQELEAEVRKLLGG